MDEIASVTSETLSLPKSRFIRIINKYWVKAFLLSLLTAAVAIVPQLIANNGILMMGGDWMALFYPQNSLLSQVAKNGEWLWNWSVDMGGNFLESITIGAPTSWIYMLVPVNAVPYIMGWVCILRLGLSGLTSSLYFKRHLKSDSAVVLSALLYAFSGSQIVNTIFYCFGDAIAFFPLLLLGMEAMLEDRKYGALALAVILNALCSLSLFFSEVLFIILYFIAKYVGLSVFKDKKLLIDRLKKAGLCMLEGALGMACLAVVVIPQVINLLGNHRISESIPIESWLTRDTREWLMFIRAYVNPAEAMNNGVTLATTDWSSNSLYLPFAGMIGVFAYLLKTKDWKSKFIKWLMVISVIPVLNTMFMAFSSVDYKRWYYMFDLVLALVTGYVFENREDYPLFKPLMFNLGAIFVFARLTSTIVWDLVTLNWVMEADEFLINLTIAAGGVIVIYRMAKKSSKAFFSVVTVCVMVSSVVMLSMNIWDSQDDENFRYAEKTYGENYITYTTKPVEGLEKDIFPYRYYFDDSCYNYSRNFAWMGCLPGSGSFLSTPHSSVFEFYHSVEYERYASSPEIRGEGFGELIGSRYVVSFQENPDYKLLGSKEILDATRTIDYKWGDDVEEEDYLTLPNKTTAYYYENEDALPIGFTYDKYMLKSDFEDLEGKFRISAMLSALVIDDELEASVSDCLEHLEDFEFRDKSADDVYREELNKFIHNAAVERKAECGTDHAQGKNTFSMKMNASTERYAFFSVPYDKHWIATVNGNSVEVLDINGFMAIRIPEGESEISFEYKYTPLLYGAVISVVSVAVFVLYFVISRKQKVTVAENAVSEGETEEVAVVENAVSEGETEEVAVVENAVSEGETEEVAVAENAVSEGETEESAEGENAESENHKEASE